MRAVQNMPGQETGQYAETEKQTELNLGMGALVGIFFVLAIVCGAFFGFGYSFGHRPAAASPPGISSASQPQVHPLAQTQNSSLAAKAGVAHDDSGAATSDSVALQSSARLPSGKPSAEVQAPAESEDRATRTMASATTSPRVNPSTRLTTSARTANPLPQEPAPLPIASGTIMVQIAAVAHRPDAEALAAALRKDGFAATVRTEPQDRLLHIQVGPFASREEAKTMRQKLTGAGYNAFIK